METVWLAKENGDDLTSFPSSSSGTINIIAFPLYATFVLVALTISSNENLCSCCWVV